MMKNIFIFVMLLPSSTVTALRMVGQKPCGLSDSADAIDFGTAPIPSEFDRKVHKDFIELVGANELAEALYVTRHRHARPQCCNDVPKAYRSFDWWVSQDGVKDNTSHPNPGMIFCKSDVASITTLLERANQLPALMAGQKRLLAVGNEDTHYSALASKGLVDQLIRTNKFTRILFETKDVYTNEVGTFPLGLSDFYIVNSGAQSVKRAILNANLEKKNKAVLAAWGAVWPELDHLASRSQAQKFLDKSCLVSKSAVGAHDWWDVLSKHRFLMTPHGNGIQLPKVAEALMVLTIPIVQRVAAFEDLKMRYGWPIVLVDKWDEITIENLKKWHEELSPKLLSFRWHLTAQQGLQDMMDKS